MKQIKIPYKRTLNRIATVGEIISQLSVHHRILAREIFGSPRFDINTIDRPCAFWFNGSYRERREWYELIDKYVKTRIEYEE